MTMKIGQCYRCLNPDCRCEIAVKRNSIESSSNPKCCCEVEMKKTIREACPARIEHHTCNLLTFRNKGRERRDSSWTT